MPRYLRNENLFSRFQAVLISLLVVLVVVFAVVMFSDSPEWIFNLLGIAEKLKYEALKFLGIGMGGILLALQALMSYKRAKAMEQTAEAQANAANAQARATEEQAKANEHTERGQRQDRLKNAIEHLGHEKDSVRLGGAYELFHLAEDTEDLRQTVLEILCAHIRQTTSEDRYRERHKSKPSEEIQSLLTLLLVREHDIFKGRNIDLGGACLKKAYLRNARLENAVLAGVNLQESDLYRTQMQGAVLWEAQMQGATLAHANMQEAKLGRAQMQGATLEHANMQGATLAHANMQGAILAHANMQGAKLRRAQMQGAVLLEAYPRGAVLEYTQMQGVASHGDSSAPFEKRIRERIDKTSDLTKVVLSRGPIEIRGAIIGSYTEEEAEQWIAEYNQAMGISEEDS